jgi:hypothetical protein
MAPRTPKKPQNVRSSYGFWGQSGQQDVVLLIVSQRPRNYLFMKKKECKNWSFYAKVVPILLNITEESCAIAHYLATNRLKT